MSRLSFLSLFILCLAIGAAAWFGVFTTVWTV